MSGSWSLCRLMRKFYIIEYLMVQWCLAVMANCCSLYPAHNCVIIKLRLVIHNYIYKCTRAHLSNQGERCWSQYRGWGEKKYTDKLQFYNYFKPNFRHLSQNWSSDGHFEVLNSSIHQLVKKLWQKWKTRKNAKNAKITKNSTYEIFFYKIALKRKWKKLHFVS